jgi:hypothetical protein
MITGLFLVESLLLRAFAARVGDYGATLIVTVRAWHREPTGPADRDGEVNGPHD